MDVPLTAEDRAILALEDARLVGHTATVVHLPDGAPDLRALRAAVLDRLPAAPRLTWRLGGTSDEPSCWVQKLPGPTRFPHVTKADYGK